jgi:hypothetical protein
VLRRRASYVERFRSSPKGRLTRARRRRGGIA